MIVEFVRGLLQSVVEKQRLITILKSQVRKHQLFSNLIRSISLLPYEQHLCQQHQQHTHAA